MIPIKNRSLYIKISAFIAMGLMAISQASLANDTYDASEFEYAGVRLGLTPQQTIDALSKNLGINPGALIERQQDNYKAIGSNGSEIEVKIINYSFGDGRWSGDLEFHTDVRKNPIMTEPGLTSIKLKRANELNTKRGDKEAGLSEDDIAQVLTDNIGPPSLRRTIWCTAVRDDGTYCEFGTPMISAGSAGSSIQMIDYELKDLLEGLRPQSVSALPGDTYDLSEFEYAGVHLGSTPQQAIEALSKNLGIHPDSFSVNHEMQHNVSGLNGSEIEIKIKYYSFRDGRWSGDLQFLTDARRNPILTEPGLAWIQLRRANELNTKIWDEEALSNRDEIAQELTDSIGPPSVSRGLKYWCMAVKDDGTHCTPATSLISVFATYRAPFGGSIQMYDYGLLSLTNILVSRSD